MKLPIFQALGNFVQMQTTWASILDLLLKNSILQGVQLTDVKLSAGTNVINHLLSRQQQGWFLTDADAAATIYRNAPFNATTLSLSSNAGVTVSLWVY